MWIIVFHSIIFIRIIQKILFSEIRFPKWGGAKVEIKSKRCVYEGWFSGKGWHKLRREELAMGLTVGWSHKYGANISKTRRLFLVLEDPHFGG